MSAPLKFQDFVDTGVKSGISSLVQQLEALDKVFKKHSNTIRQDAGVIKAALKSLSASAGNYKQSVNTLIAKLAKLETENKKLSKSYKESQAALKKANRETEAAAKKMKKLDDATKKAGKSAGGFSKGFKQIAGAVTVANIATGIFYKTIRLLKDTLVGGVKIMAEFESQMAAVKAITGSTSEEMQKLTQDAIRLGGATIFTASQVGALQIAYGKLGFKTQEILAATEATLDLAAATDEGLASSAAIAGSTLRAFQMDASEMGRVVDTMAKSFTSSALDMEKFRESMKFVAPVARKAGFEIEETTAILAKLADTGLYGSLAGTSMRNILLKMADSSSELSMALGGSVHNMRDFIDAMRKMEKEGISLSRALELTDQRAVTAFATLADLGDELEEMVILLEASAGASKEMADIRMDTLTGKVTILKSAWEGVVLAIDQSTSATSFLGQMVEGVIDKMVRLREAILPRETLFEAEIESEANKAMTFLKDASRNAVVERKKETAALLRDNKEKLKDGKAFDAARKKILEDFNEFKKNKYKEDLDAFVKSKEIEVGRLEHIYGWQLDEYQKYLRVLKRERKKAQLEDETGDITKRTSIEMKELADLGISDFRQRRASGVLMVQTLEKELDIFLDSNEAIKTHAVSTRELTKATKQYFAIINDETLKEFTESSAFDFDDWAKGEKARIEAMEDGLEKDIALRTFTFEKLKHILTDQGDWEISKKTAISQLNKDIKELEFKYEQEALSATILAMEEGIDKQIMLETQKWDKIIHKQELAGKSILMLEKAKQEAIVEMMAKYTLTQVRLSQSLNKAENQMALDNLDNLTQIKLDELAASKAIADQKRDWDAFDKDDNKEYEKQYQDDKLRIITEGEIARLNLEIEMSKRRKGALLEDIEEIRMMIEDAQAIGDKTLEYNLTKQLNELLGEGAGLDKLVAELKLKMAELGVIGIDKTSSDDQNFLSRLFGIDNKDLDEWNDFIGELEKGAKKIADIVEDIADAAVESADRQVEASRSRVESLQRDLEHEYDLMQDGKANKYSIIKEELTRAKAAQEESEEVQRKALKVKQAIDTATQISSLATATANIIEGWSSIPIAGQVLGAVSVAAMWGTFLAAKAKAIEVTGFKEGVIDIQGEGTGTSDSINAKLSKGESVMTANETNRFKPVFEAIRNRDDMGALMALSQLVNPDIYKKMDSTISLEHNLDSVMGKYYGSKVEGNYRIEKFSGNHTRKSRIR